MDVDPTAERLWERVDMGPDRQPDEAALGELAGGRRGHVKSLLMNQQVIAGIGNVYSDEILFQARIHPECPVAGRTYWFCPQCQPAC